MTDARPVLVVDFGAQYAQLIARRVREAKIYSEVVPSTMAVADMLAKNPLAIILSGGPSSVYADGAPQVDAALFDSKLPVFGICYGFQAMAATLGGTVAQTGLSEFGATELTVNAGSCLFAGLPAAQNVWMSHGDSVQQAPEVMHSEHGQKVLEHFLYDIAKLDPTWTPAGIVDEQVARIKAQVGDSKVICGLSGGVDSAVAAALVHKAVGDNLTCVFVDHGLLRAGEREQVERDYVAATGIRLVVIDAADRFLTELADVTDPETKRKIIGRIFIRVFEDAQKQLIAEAGESGATIDFLVQGTLYPDVVESGGGTGAATIKSHHNVGGLPDDIEFQLCEPLRELFKDEVRAVGRELGLPDAMVMRHPFPGPGLGIRIVGAVSKERLDILRAADAIVREETTIAGLDSSIWQFPVVLLADVRSVGVQGDGRTYGHPIVLRPVSSEDAMTADWTRLPYEVLAKISNRITNEVREVNRVVLDVTSKPPGTIEWE